MNGELLKHAEYTTYHTQQHDNIVHNNQSKTSSTTQDNKFDNLKYK
jgi:hypothetical protein